jgi:hypothetical protein
VLRLLEARRIVDDRRSLIADPAEHAAMFIREARRHGVIHDEPADQPSFERQRTRQQRHQLFAMRAAAVGA